VEGESRAIDSARPARSFSAVGAGGCEDPHSRREFPHTAGTVICCKKAGRVATTLIESDTVDTARQDDLYEQAAAAFGGAVSRLASVYEADPDKRADLRQDIHIGLWRSFAGFNGTCSLRTWVYRVAHNVAASHVLRHRRARAPGFVSLDMLETEPVDASPDVDRQLALDRLLALIRRLKPLDRQVISLYLEGEDAATIGEITGLAAGNIAVKVHRIKALLSRQFAQGGGRADEPDTP